MGTIYEIPSIGTRWVVGEDATTPGQVQDVETSPPIATPDKRLCIHVEQPSILAHLYNDLFIA